MKKITYIITLVLLASIVKAQNTPFDKKIFKERKDEYKVAKRNLDEGNELYDLHPSTYIDVNDPIFVTRKRYYTLALPFFFNANKFNPNNAELNYKLGRCYLMSSAAKDKCIDHFLKAVKLEPYISQDLHYHLGIGYHLTMEFDKAIAAFTKVGRELGVIS